jgi:hypothetical protein
MAEPRKKDAEPRKHDDEQEELEQALRHEHREDLLGQIEENVNLTGSTTWETLGDNRDAEEEPDAERQRERAQRAERGKESADRSRSTPQPPRTTKGGITSPKFGSATSGGGELEPGPEAD